MKKLVFFLSFLLSYSVVHAQYFGRNKVQYEKFDFQVMTTEHFKIFFYPRTSQSVYDAANMLERWYDRHAKVFGIAISGKQPVILYANHSDFQQTNIINELIPQGTGGVTEGMANRIILPFTGVNKDDEHVLGHELVHAFQYNIMQAKSNRMAAGEDLPLWIIEGMAEFLSLGHQDANTSMWLRDAVLYNDVPSMQDMARNPKYFPYRWGQAMWAFIAGHWGDYMVPTLFSSSLNNGFDKSVENLFRMPVDSLSKKWVREVKTTYAAEIQGRSKPEDVGRNLISEQGGMNISPELSPDGKYLAYLTRKEVFTIDLFLADAKTGKPLHKLISTDTDAHFDALRFMNSAGAWSPDSKSFAFIVLRKGNSQIAIADVESKTIRREIATPDVDEITHISWSPDGKTLAISGNHDGISDLYLYDLKAGSIKALTNDKYSDIHPCWSPDGSTIAFATDRGDDTDLKLYKFGEMQIGLYDLATGKIRLIAMKNGQNHINPRFSPDGRSLYMLANPDGISDIYRYDLENNSWFRVTRIATGVAGITDTSPALSISQGTGEVAFSVFEKGDYNIHGLQQQDAQGVPVDINDNDYAANTTLPPAQTEPGLVTKNLANLTDGLPQNANFAVSNYHSNLKLMYVGQPAIGIGVNSFGAGIGGGFSMLFSDLLGNHYLGLAAQANGSFRDIGGQTVYQNLGSRFNWGVAVGHIPYLTGEVLYGVDSVQVGNQTIPAATTDYILERVYLNEISAIGTYPLSINRRFEIGMGFQRISYNFQVQRTLQTLAGDYLGQDTINLPAPQALNLYQGNLAYVGDYSYYGFTGPVRGKAFRFEVQPTFGSLFFSTVLADYRQYIFLRPLTFAVRALHYGRYLRDSENYQLTPLTVGFNTLVRGYDPNNFTASEYSQFNRIIGSRIGVFNAELRLPLFGNEEFGLINFPYLPTDLAVFFDGGVAWDANSPPKIEWSATSSERIPVFSTGVAARINILGYLVGQVFWVYPFQRPEKGAHFGFALSPAW
jgi:hypothetical protein